MTKNNFIFFLSFFPTEFYKDENPDDEDDDGGRYHLQNAVRPQGILIFHDFLKEYFFLTTVFLY